MNAVEFLSSIGGVANLGGFVLAIQAVRMNAAERKGWCELIDRYREDAKSCAEEKKALRADLVSEREEKQTLQHLLERNGR